jgi:hypothetical protein
VHLDATPVPARRPAQHGLSSQDAGEGIRAPGRPLRDSGVELMASSLFWDLGTNSVSQPQAQPRKPQPVSQQRRMAVSEAVFTRLPPA